MKKSLFMITFLLVGLFAYPAFAEIKQYSFGYAGELLDSDSGLVVDAAELSPLYRLVEYEPYNDKMAIDAVMDSNYEYSLIVSAIESNAPFEVGWKQVFQS